MEISRANVCFHGQVATQRNGKYALHAAVNMEYALGLTKDIFGTVNVMLAGFLKRKCVLRSNRKYYLLVCIFF